MALRIRNEMSEPWQRHLVFITLSSPCVMLCSVEGPAGDGHPAADVATMAVQYSRKFVTANDSVTALYYRWLAAMARGGSLGVKGMMLRELLVCGRDFGTLLGGGGAGARGALHALVPDPEERRRLFEGVAYECQVDYVCCLSFVRC